MELRLGTLRQIGVTVFDLDRAVAFYRDVLGMRVIARFGDLAFLDMDGIRLFMEADSEVVGSSVLYFAVPDVREACAELEQRGVTIEGAPHVIHTDVDGTFGPAGEQEWMAFFRDTEGNLLAVSSRELPE
jgi:methylmalonyl-CoA/ethylmalonyl-CoA epimerase